MQTPHPAPISPANGPANGPANSHTNGHSIGQQNGHRLGQPLATTHRPRPRLLHATWLGAGLLVALQATAQVPTAPLVCVRAAVTVFPACSGGPTICPPGSGGPGMLQKTGVPLVTGVTGGALAGGYAGPSSTRPVFFSYAVPDVRVFAPDTAKVLLTAVSTRTWVIKNSSVPGTTASDSSEAHLVGDVGVAVTGESNTLGSNPGGPWMLVGQVLARAYMRGYSQYVSYGFSCTLPVQNLAPVFQLR